MADDFDDDDEQPPRPRRRSKNSTEGAYRNTDGESAREAAGRVDVTYLELKVMEFLQRRPPTELYTSLEIAAHVGENVWSISPRMKPLKDKELVWCEKKYGLNSNGKVRKMDGYRAALPGDYPPKRQRRSSGPQPNDDDGFGPAFVLADCEK